MPQALTTCGCEKCIQNDECQIYDDNQFFASWEFECHHCNSGVIAGTLLVSDQRSHNIDKLKRSCCWICPTCNHHEILLVWNKTSPCDNCLQNTVAVMKSYNEENYGKLCCIRCNQPTACP
ncbi:MAG: hypothetical protein Satyrvirus43_3 [Satyrvirus sp.]|uniref:Uncharacterized protein n=1 Tax=Satyrvirus sp. TaxID=2487771 RepID=A0A3G5AJM4_9VIRU|nr:MAG: hypothetical protein Satyrvirus43_3 [Satyrvirus sp.]